MQWLNQILTLEVARVSIVLGLMESDMDLLPGQITIFDYFEKPVVEEIKVRLFELFSGYGSQSLALEMFGVDYESVGYAEIDKYAIQAYKALHGEHIKNYGDITKIDANTLPYMDLLTYSFPCQDISVAGKQRGIDKNSGTRSSLLWECQRIIEVKRPRFLMMENVKNLVGKQNLPNFIEWLQVLSNLGYNNYWKVTNAKYCGIPHNRERVFCVSILKEFDDGSFKYEEQFDNGLRLKDLLESEVDEKYYLDDEKCSGLISQIKEKNQDVSYCIDANYWKGTTAQQFLDKSRRQIVCVKEATKLGYAIANEGDSINLEHPNSKTRRGRVGVAQTLTTSCNQAVVEPNEINQIGNLIETDSFGGNPQVGRIYGVEGIAPTLNTCGVGQRELKIQEKFRIRKLTPTECFRLMGLNDSQIAKIQSTGISNSQQYKMAGNSIVVQQMAFLKNLSGIRKR